MRTRVYRVSRVPEGGSVGGPYVTLKPTCSLAWAYSSTAEYVAYSLPAWPCGEFACEVAGASTPSSRGGVAPGPGRAPPVAPTRTPPPPGPNAYSGEYGPELGRVIALASEVLQHRIRADLYTRV